MSEAQTPQHGRAVRVAMAQMLVEGGRPEANLARAVERIREAASRGADVVVLPEASELGWTDESALHEAAPIPGPRSDAIAKAAADAGISVVIGLTEQAPEGVYNTSLFVDPTGRIVGTHRKVNVLEIAQGLYRIGSSLGVLDSPLGRVAIPICADNSGGSLSLPTALARLGARLILSPSAWAVRPDRRHETDPYGEVWVNPYRRLALRFRMPVVGVSCVGMLRSGAWAGYRAIGRSLAVDSDGSVVVHGPFGEDADTLLLATVHVMDDFPVGTGISRRLEEHGFESF